MFNIGNVKIKYPLLLAPMAGVTNMPFRTICKKMGASMMYTEFVSAEGIIRENTKTLDMIKFADFERPIGVQIFGDNPEVVGKSAKYINKKFKPDIIDINFGCPVPKITKKGAGSAALRDLSLMNDIATSVVENTNGTPVTAKIRAGWDSNSIVAIDAGKLLEKIGLKAMTLHARTTKQGYSGKSDWKLIKELKKEVNIPVIGNGDVFSIADAIRMKTVTNCDAVMIGRAAMANPWIFSGRDTASLRERIELACQQLELMTKFKGERIGIFETRKHLGLYFKQLPRTSKFRKQLLTTECLTSLLSLLRNSLETEFADKKSNNLSLTKKEAGALAWGADEVRTYCSTTTRA